MCVVIIHCGHCHKPFYFALFYFLTADAPESMTNHYCKVLILFSVTVARFSFIWICNLWLTWVKIWNKYERQCTFFNCKHEFFQSDRSFVITVAVLFDVNLFWDIIYNVMKATRISHDIKTHPNTVFVPLLTPKRLWPIRTWTGDLQKYPVVPGTGTMAGDLLVLLGGLVRWGVLLCFVISHEYQIGLGVGEFGGQGKALSCLSCSLNPESCSGGMALSWRLFSVRNNS